MIPKLYLIAGTVVAAALTAAAYVVMQTQTTPQSPNAPVPVDDGVVMTPISTELLDYFEANHMTVDASRLYPASRIDALHRAVEDYLCTTEDETPEESVAKHDTMMRAFAALTTR